MRVRMQLKSSSELSVHKVKSVQNIADIFTKSVNLQIFSNLRSELHVIDTTKQTETGQIVDELIDQSKQTK